jgi:hypothetical protein
MPGVLTLPSLLPPTSGASGSYSARIGGTLVSVIAGSVSIDQQIGQRSTGSIQVWTALGNYWSYGTQVLLYDGDGVLVFAGYVSGDKATKSGARLGVGYLEHSIALMDNCYRADKRVAFKSYRDTAAGDIVRALVDSILVDESVVYTSTSIATGPNIPEVVWNGKQVSECLNWLASQAGYWWNIDMNGVLSFLPYGGVSAPFTLDGTQVDATQNLSVEYGNPMYVNKQYVKGAYGEKGSATAQLHETFKGDGANRSFTLSISHQHPVLRPAQQRGCLNRCRDQGQQRQGVVLRAGRRGAGARPQPRRC